MRFLRIAVSAILVAAATVAVSPQPAQASLTTFTLPGADANGDINYPNLVSAFPAVDWETVDRLYLPAGQYRSIHLGGLPVRSASDPLVITNSGGQVRVGGENHPYIFAVNGGKNWVLTGRYDPVAQTGHSAYPGHAGGWAHSQDTYGILIDDEFSRAGGIGLSISSGASHFELDMIEIRHAEFAGLVMKTDDNPAAVMRNVRVHDLYIHDTGSEGIYLGSTQPQPQHPFENLEIYNNRVLRTGSEALQVGQLGRDVAVHHNVFGPAATRWRSMWMQWQDGNIQWGQRYGSATFHHNIVIGTGDLFLEFFPTTVSGDPWSASDTVSFHDNYFADTSYGGIFTHTGGTGVDLEFTDNTFRGFTFTYDEVYPSVSEPPDIFAPADNVIAHTFTDTTIDGPYPLQAAPRPNVTEVNTIYATVPRAQFRDFMGSYLDQDYRRLEWWTDRATLAPGSPVMVYQAGDVVVHRGVLYQALVTNQEQPPDLHPTVWQQLPQPADDVRLAAASPHGGLGVGDSVTGYLPPDDDEPGGGGPGEGALVGIGGTCVAAQSGADGAVIELATCDGTAAQTWTMPGDGTIRALGKCLDVAGGLTGNGSFLWLWTCNGTGAQSWQPGPNDSFVNPNSGRCLDTQGGASTNGTRLVIYDCNASASQSWTLQ